MKKSARAKARTSSGRAKRRWSTLAWLGAGAFVVLMGYAALEVSGVPYDDKAIGVVDFSLLTASQKRTALRAANRSRCPCGCAMNTAQCVATDSTCPLREENIQKIRTMVRDARQAS